MDAHRVLRAHGGCELLERDGAAWPEGTGRQSVEESIIAEHARVFWMRLLLEIVIVGWFKHELLVGDTGLSEVRGKQ